MKQQMKTRRLRYVTEQKNREIRSITAKKAGGRIAFLAAVCAVVFLVSFAIGRYPVPLLQVVRILWNAVLKSLKHIFGNITLLKQTWTDSMEAAVLMRLPRIVLACLVGMALSIAGTAYQSVFRNPMAAPDILGASSGACFGAALAILLGRGQMQITAFAFGFSLLTVFLVYLVAGRARGSRLMNLLLSGVMISSLFSAGTSYIKLVADPANELPAITYWLMGSLNGARTKDLLFAALPMTLALIPLLLFSWRINLLTLDEKEARTMGISINKLRAVVILCATLLTAASVAVSGMIGWVGLVIPHLCRKLVGNDCRHLFPAAFFFGAAFLLLVDDVSRNLLQTEIPIGILTAFVGAPFFIWLMMRKENTL